MVCSVPAVVQVQPRGAWQERVRSDVAQHRPDWSRYFKAPKNVYLPVPLGQEEQARRCGARRGHKGSLCCLYEAKALDRLREFLPLGYRASSEGLL